MTMEIAELATWTIGWNRNTAHLFEDGETAVAQCNNKIPRVGDRRLLVNPDWMTFVYLNEKTFCHPCVKATRKCLGVRVDDFGLHYGDTYGWSDDPKDIAILSGAVDSRRGKDHHYHPLADLQPGHVEKYSTPIGVGYFWVVYDKSPVRYIAVENIPFDKESDVKEREALKAARAAGLGDAFTGHPLRQITASDLAGLENAMAHQMDAIHWLSSHMPISKKKTGSNRRNSA